MKIASRSWAALLPLLVFMLGLTSVGCQSQSERLRGIPDTCEMCR